MSDQTPFSNYRMTVRIELINRPHVFATVVSVLAKEKANLGAVDIVDVTSKKIVRDITFDVSGEEHSERILARLKKEKNINVISSSDRIFLFHLGGKISVQSKVPLNTRHVLSTAYTPGVARVSQAIADNPSKVYSLTIKGNSIAIVTDGSAVLGLGNLGPEAALPVMEGKAMIFREFAGLNAWPICLNTQDEDEIVRTIENIAPTFGAINLEDISAPRCFSIEKRLRKSLDIPVMHDDQHVTAVVIYAALKNALKIVGKDIRKIKVVVNGMGAAGVACCQILLAAGVKNLYGCDVKGNVLHVNESNLKTAKKDIFACLDKTRSMGTLHATIVKADVFIGVSVGNVLKAADIKSMKKKPIVFAMANPNPEIAPEIAAKYCTVYATGRSDLPNQINNALAFPGMFKGALSVRASEINEKMKIAAANAIANLISADQLNTEYIIPSIFDKRVVQAVTNAVAIAAHKSGVARRALRKEHDADPSAVSNVSL